MTTTEHKIFIYVDMDDTLCDFKGAYYRYSQTHPDIKFPQSIPNFFCELAPLPDAIETFQWLSAQPQFDVFILTAPSVKNPLCYTEKRLWIEDHLGFEATKQLVISRHKHLQKGHYLIDDQVTGRGQDQFEGIVIQFGSSAFPNWRSVRAYFELLIEQGQLPRFATPFNVEFDRQLIACHEDSHSYLYESIGPFGDFMTSAVLHLDRPERCTLDKNEAGIEQLRIDIRPETMDHLAIAWCKHRKLQGALGGPVGREWGSPDCEYD